MKLNVFIPFNPKVTSGLCLGRKCCFEEQASGLKGPRCSLESYPRSLDVTSPTVDMTQAGGRCNATLAVAGM